KLPPGGILPTPAAPKPTEADAAKQPTPLQTASGTAPASTTPAAPAPATPPAASPPVADTPAAPPTAGPSIASLIDNMSGPTGGWRIQIASVKSEDIAKSTWAKVQTANGDVLTNLKMQPVRVNLGDKGTWYRVQAGPLDEKQAHSVCGTLKSRKSDCVIVPPAR
ncbi:MAG: SPOR domain-containing protein, partial [Proteobacteria bacterium]|nr:SPOR domain-containing protein [Pseudomonadota bacterium]